MLNSKGFMDIYQLLGNPTFDSKEVGNLDGMAMNSDGLIFVNPCWSWGQGEQNESEGNDNSRLHS